MSWVNQVERYFDELTDKQLRRGVHRSTQELEDAIHAHIEATNDKPEPFRWVKTADRILNSIKRFCTRKLETAQKQTEIVATSEAGHESILIFMRLGTIKYRIPTRRCGVSMVNALFIETPDRVRGCVIRIIVKML